MQISKQSSSYILTADIGGSHITTAICNMTRHSIVPESITRVEINSKGLANDILSSWGNALKESINKSAFPVSGLAVAMPGPFDYEKGISYIKGLNKYEALYGINIKEYFAGIMPIDGSQIMFRNDAESTVAGEALIGAGKGYQVVMGVTLGTGFGSAYSNNNITRDINLGSDPYKETIADDYLSTRWFVKRYNELTGVVLTGGVKELSALAAENEVARLVFKEFAANMADFLSAAIKQYTPEVLIICGNIAKASEFFLPYLAEELNSTTIKLAQLDEHAPLIGAAAMFDNVTPSSFKPVTNL
jgi:glucokinase